MTEWNNDFLTELLDDGMSSWFSVCVLHSLACVEMPHFTLKPKQLVYNILKQKTSRAYYLEWRLLLVYIVFLLHSKRPPLDSSGPVQSCHGNPGEAAGGGATEDPCDGEPGPARNRSVAPGDRTRAPMIGPTGGEGRGGL